MEQPEHYSGEAPEGIVYNIAEQQEQCRPQADPELVIE